MFKTLQKLGLTNKEAKVYLTNLELGPAKIPEIAKKSKIKRTTVYVVLDSLIQKGLASIYQSKKTKKFIAEEPERLNSLLQEKQDSLKQIMPQLQALTKTKGKKRPEVRFYQGRQGCLTIVEQTLEIPNSEILYIGSLQDIYKICTLQYDHNHYIPTRLKKNIKFKALLFKDKGALNLKKQEKQHLRAIKFLPQNYFYFFESSMFIFQDKIALISSEKELVSIVIQSPDLAKMEEQKFRLL